jgi:DNA-binding transcriptional MerR regulator
VLDPGTRSSPDTCKVTQTASNSRPLRSGELARRSGVSPDALRHYERRGLLPRPERSAAGYRLYSPEALDRVRLIRGALSIGFTVNELGAILADRDHGGAPCRRVRGLAADKLAAVERQLRTLRLWRRELRSALADWDRRLRATPRGKRAGLLDAFVVAHPKSPERSSPLLTPNLRKSRVLREERK